MTSNAQQTVSASHHTYSDIHISGNSRVHQGDVVINNFYPRTEGEENVFNALRDSLTFERMTARFRNVAHALPSTCEWIFTLELFQIWANNDWSTPGSSNVLWIKGKPGSGKSTIMKTLVEWARKAWDNEILVFYFLNARAPSELEKSALGLYRMMLYQLVREWPPIETTFLQTFSSKFRQGVVEVWTEAELRDFLLRYLSSSQAPSMNVFVDALDEGDEMGIRQLVEFWEDLSQLVSSSVRLRICLSSRHFPHITMDNSLSISVERQSEHHRDISCYIDKKLRGQNDPSMEKLQCKLLEKASGVFLWVVLVVRMLNQLHDGGRSVQDMYRRLEEVPAEIEDLLDSVLHRDRKDLDECMALLQWVLFALRPLAPIELYWAVQHWSQMPDESEQHVTPRPATVARFILDCSRGLVELVDISGDSTTIQVIHETVRDYLLAKRAPVPRIPNFSRTKTTRLKLDATQGHIRLAEICLHRCLRVGPQSTSSITLLEYAAEFWHKHLQAAGADLEEKVLDLAYKYITGDQRRIQACRKFYDIDGGPSASQAAGISEPLAPLYHAALTGSVPLTVRILCDHPHLDAFCGRYGTALQAASACGHTDVINILLDAGADVNAKLKQHASALQVAAMAGHTAVVHQLLAAGADCRSRAQIDSDQFYPASVSVLEAAIWCRHFETARIFLQAPYFDAISLADLKRALTATSRNNQPELVDTIFQLIQGRDPGLKYISARIIPLTGVSWHCLIWRDTTGKNIKDVLNYQDGIPYSDQYLVAIDRFLAEADTVPERAFRHGLRIDRLLPIWNFRRHKR